MNEQIWPTVKFITKFLSENLEIWEEIDLVHLRYTLQKLFAWSNVHFTKTICME